MSEILPAGKLPPHLLGPFLASITNDPSVIIGPGIGRDAAAVRFGDRVLVLKTDPITFATDEIGWYAVNVNANDIACMGATPRWMLVTTLLPDGATTPALVERIFNDLLAACDTLGINLIGGHTEITAGLDRPILVGQMIGETFEDQLIDPRRSQPGDAVILAQGIAIEGTAILAREWRETLTAKLGADLVERAAGFLHDPGISVVKAARALTTALGDGVHALHDPTEGGLASGLRELGAAAGLGITVDGDAIPVYPETRALCDLLGLDPLGLIASGALLATVAWERAPEALAALEAADVQAAVIGRLHPDPDHVTLNVGGREQPLPEFAVDEIARFFADAEDDA